MQEFRAMRVPATGHAILGKHVLQHFSASPDKQKLEKFFQINACDNISKVKHIFAEFIQSKILPVFQIIATALHYVKAVWSYNTFLFINTLTLLLGDSSKHAILTVFY